MNTKLTLSQNRLSNAIYNLDLAIEKLANRRVPEDATKQDYLIRLNDELKSENLMLKEQLFAAISNMNNFKDKHQKVYDEIEDVVASLEKLLG